VVVISHDFWINRLGGQPVVGDDLRINGRPYTVVGIAPDGFTGKSMPGVQSDLWLPYQMYPHLNPGQQESGNLGITARVKDGVATGTAVTAVNALSQRIDADRKAAGREDDYVVRAFPWSGMFIHPDMDGPIVAAAALLMAVVGVVLLVACVNLAGFLLARATDRRREIALRLALGASRTAVVRQLMIEALVLGAAGGVLGLGLGVVTVRGLTSIDTPLVAASNFAIPLDGAVLLFTAGMSLVAALLFGLTPALQASRAPVNQVLRDESTAVAGGRIGLRNALVVAQMALAVVLLVGAGLFLRSLKAAAAIDPGFDTGPAAIVSLNGQASGYDSAREFVPVVERLLQQLETTPGIDAAAVGRMPLGMGVWVKFFDVPGVAPPAGRQDHRIEFTPVSARYFDVMGIPILQGRAFGSQDGAETPPVMIVSRALAERYWPGESAVGRTMIPVRDRDHPVTIVGVAEDVDVWTLGEEQRPYFYMPLTQSPASWLAIVTRGNQAPVRQEMAVRQALRTIDADIFVPSTATMADHLADTTFLPRMAAILIGSFAALAMVLSVIGLYGVVSYGVARRTREMGIRMSLGADRNDVIGLVVRGGVGLAAVGIALGLVAATVASGYLEGFLIGVDGRDPLTLVGVPLLLLSVALLAAFLPARRASKVDPMVALRSE
jgi:putative ABC transport system permease protein